MAVSTNRARVRRRVALSPLVSVALLAGVAVGIVSCRSDRTVPPVLVPAFHVDGVEPRLAPVGPYDWEEVTSLDRYELDARGLPIVRYDGIPETQPTTLAAFGLINLNSWRLTRDERALQLAVAAGRELLRIGEQRARSSIWLPFHFDFALHGNRANTIHAPWYSAMTQGQVLSLFVRLHRVTGDDEWKVAGRRVFETFRLVAEYDRLPDGPWIDFVDERGYLWLEEYAGDVAPMMVLNGHIYAMFGLFDWWALTGDDTARRLFDGAATTVLAYVPELRNPGYPSWYGYRVRDDLAARSEIYHYEHIWLLDQLGVLTGDVRFHELADDLYSDFGTPEGRKHSFPD